MTNQTDDGATGPIELTNDEAFRLLAELVEQAGGKITFDPRRRRCNPEFCMKLDCSARLAESELAEAKAANADLSYQLGKAQGEAEGHALVRKGVETELAAERARVRDMTDERDALLTLAARHSAEILQSVRIAKFMQDCREKTAEILSPQQPTRMTTREAVDKFLASGDEQPTRPATEAECPHCGDRDHGAEAHDPWHGVAAEQVAPPPVEPRLSITGHLPNLVEFPRRVQVGDKLGDDERLVLAVRDLGVTCRVAGSERPLFAVVAEKDHHGSMLTMGVALDEAEQAVAAGGEPAEPASLPEIDQPCASSGADRDIEAVMAKTDCSAAGCGDLARTYGLCFAHAAAAGRDAAHAAEPAGPPAQGVSHWLKKSWEHHERDRTQRGVTDGAKLTDADHAFIELWHAVRVLEGKGS